MAVIITSDHFDLPETARGVLERKLEKLYRVLPPDSNLRLTLKANAKGHFSATLQAHAGQKDYVCSATGNQLVGTVSAVEAFLHRRLVAMNQKRVHSRRRTVLAV